jgi:hypothetical protein
MRLPLRHILRLRLFQTLHERLERDFVLYPLLNAGRKTFREDSI